MFSSSRVLLPLFAALSFHAILAGAQEPVGGSGAPVPVDNVGMPWNNELGGSKSTPTDTRSELPPGTPVPAKDTRPPDDTIFELTPAPDLAVRGGYNGYGDGAGFNHGGAVGVLMFLDGGRTGVVLSGDVAGGQGTPFAYAGGKLNVQYRIPFDPKHVIWGGVGVNIDGRYSHNPHAEGYFQAQLPVAYIGTMFQVAGKCVVHLFAKAAFGIYDSHGQADHSQALNNWVRPMAGAELLTQCGSLRVMGDYQHLFGFGQAGNVDLASLEVAKTWLVKNKFNMGFYTKGQFEHDQGGEGLPFPNGRNSGSLMFGVEVRFRGL